MFSNVHLFETASEKLSVETRRQRGFVGEVRRLEQTCGIQHPPDGAGDVRSRALDLELEAVV